MNSKRLEGGKHTFEGQQIIYPRVVKKFQFKYLVTWLAMYLGSTTSLHRAIKTLRILITIFLEGTASPFFRFLHVHVLRDKNITETLINETEAIDRALIRHSLCIANIPIRSSRRSEISRHYDQLIVNDILPWCPWTCGNSKQRRTSTRMTGATRSWHSAAWLLRFALISRPTLPVCPADARWHVF